MARFSGPQHAFDLVDLVDLSAHLLEEAHLGANGHCQMTILRHDATTMVLFAFEAGGHRAEHHAEHRANGLVTIHALDGALSVDAEGEAGQQTHELGAQGILELSPGVLHSVVGRVASRMLLTVRLESAAPPQ